MKRLNKSQYWPRGAKMHADSIGVADTAEDEEA